MENKMVEVSGNTYPIREELKAQHARWDGVRKVWTLTEEGWDRIVFLHGAGANKKGREKAAAIASCTVTML